jgi:hypothetical protein
MTDKPVKIPGPDHPISIEVSCIGLRRRAPLTS